METEELFGGGFTLRTVAHSILMKLEILYLVVMEMMEGWEVSVGEGGGGGRSQLTHLVPLGSFCPSVRQKS